MSNTPDPYSRRFRLIREFEVTSSDPLINLEIQEIFSTASNKQIDAHLVKSNFEWLDEQGQKQEV